MEVAHELFRYNSCSQGPGACSLGSLLSGCKFSELQRSGEFDTILNKGEARADFCLRSQVVWTGTIPPGTGSLHSMSALERTHWNSWKAEWAIELIVRMSRDPVLESGLWYSFISVCKDAAYHPGIPLNHVYPRVKWEDLQESTAISSIWRSPLFCLSEVWDLIHLEVLVCPSYSQEKVIQFRFMPSGIPKGQLRSAWSQDHA